MNPSALRGVLLDTTALVALGSSHQASHLITSAARFRRPLFAPVTCVDAADRIRLGIAKHVGQLAAVEIVELTYTHVLNTRERYPDLPPDLAHVIALAHPGPEWPGGLIVATTQPHRYEDFDLPIYPIDT